MTALVGTLRAHGPTREAWGIGVLHVEEVDDGTATPGHEVTVVGGQIGLAAPGERLRLAGRWVEHTRYGRQFEIERQESDGIVSDAEAHRWLQRLDGVGPVRARAIYEHCLPLGGALAVLSATDAVPDPLLEVEGLSETTVRVIRESWEQVALLADPETLAYLDGLKLTRWESEQVLSCARKHRLGARELLATDPYLLIGQRGIGFARADRIALAAGLSPVAPARADAAALHVLGELCEADTHVSQRELLAGVCELIGVALEGATAAVDRMAEADRLVLRVDEAGKVWAHPPGLLAAEREVLRAIKGGVERAVEARRLGLEREQAERAAPQAEVAAEQAEAHALDLEQEQDDAEAERSAPPTEAELASFARAEAEWDAARAAEERARPADLPLRTLNALMDELAAGTPGGGEDW